jgi:hypothetical protein
VSSDPKWQEYEDEVARRLAAAYLSAHTGSAFNTMYRKLKDKKPGKLWMTLARMAIQGVAAGGDPGVNLEELDLKGPVQ